MSTRSHRVVRLVLLDDTEPDAAGWGGRSNDRDVVLPDLDVAAGRGLEQSDPGQAEPQQESSIWWEVLAFFMEGFALYGAALHPTAAVPVRTMLVAERNRPPCEDDRNMPEQDRACDGAESYGIVVPLDRARPLAAQQEPRWTWLRSLGETLRELSSYLRREREIRLAVAALTELDDRTLRDLGIHGRSHIERMVRYCRDC